MPVQKKKKIPVFHFQDYFGFFNLKLIICEINTFYCPMADFFCANVFTKLVQKEMAEINSPKSWAYFCWLWLGMMIFMSNIN